MKSLRDAFQDHLIAAAEIDSDIIAIDCDVKKHCRLDEFEKRFPDRFFQAGAREQHAVSMAAGFARAGKKPVIAAFAAFIGPRAYEQLRNSVGLQQLPVLIVGSHAGVSSGEDGASHQAYDDMALFSLLPDFHVHAPGDAADVGLCVSEFLSGHSPTYMRFGRIDLPALPEVGSASAFRAVCGDGPIALISTGEAVHIARQAIVESGLLSQVRLFHVSRIRPLPALPEELLSCSTWITLEDHYISGGLFAAIMEASAAFDLKTKTYPIGALKRYGETGDEPSLRSIMGIDQHEILHRLRGLIRGLPPEPEN